MAKRVKEFGAWTLHADGTLGNAWDFDSQYEAQSFVRVYPFREGESAIVADDGCGNIIAARGSMRACLLYLSGPESPIRS